MKPTAQRPVSAYRVIVEGFVRFSPFASDNVSLVYAPHHPAKRRTCCSRRSAMLEARVGEASRNDGTFRLHGPTRRCLISRIESRECDERAQGCRRISHAKDRELTPCWSGMLWGRHSQVKPALLGFLTWVPSCWRWQSEGWLFSSARCFFSSPFAEAVPRQTSRSKKVRIGSGAIFARSTEITVGTRVKASRDDRPEGRSHSAKGAGVRLCQQPAAWSFKKSATST
jgi:hypothetical protein